MTNPEHWPAGATCPNVLTLDRYISIEDLIERVIAALHERRPFGLVRWGDGENRIISEGRYDAQGEFRHVANFLTLKHYIPFRQRFLAGIERVDILGMFPHDYWTCRVLHDQKIDIAGKPLVYAWCNRHWNTRREWADEVLNRPWRTILVGNRMSEYAPWLLERFALKITDVFPARDYPDVDMACAKFAKLKPELVLVSAGWYAPLIVEAAKMACGAVALDYGHCPDYHLDGYMLPNTCCPCGPLGCRQHYAHAHPTIEGQPMFPDSIHQEREIVLPTKAETPVPKRRRRTSWTRQN